MPTWCNNVIYWSFFSSTCFGRIRPSSGAINYNLQHMVFCTQFVDWWWSWEPLRRSCVRCGWCRATQRLSRTAPSAPTCRTTEFLCTRNGTFPPKHLPFNSYRTSSPNIMAAEMSIWQLISSQSRDLRMCAADFRQNSSLLNKSIFSDVMSAAIITLQRLNEEFIYLIERLCFSLQMDSRTKGSLVYIF